MMKLPLSALLGFVGARAATIEVNYLSGRNIITMEDVDPGAMTVHDLRKRVVSAKGGPSAGPYPAYLSFWRFGTVNVGGPEEHRGDWDHDTRTVAEAFNFRARKLRRKQAAGRLILTAVFHGVAQRVRDACAAATEPRDGDLLSLVERVKQVHEIENGDLPPTPESRSRAVFALTSALQTVADVLGLQLADRFLRHSFEKKQGKTVVYHRHTDGGGLVPIQEVDWKQRADEWFHREGPSADEWFPLGDMHLEWNLPLMPGAFRWQWRVLTKDGNFSSSMRSSKLGTIAEEITDARRNANIEHFGTFHIVSVSVEGAPQWVREALDACWVAAAETSDIREARPVHYAETVAETWPGRKPGWPRAAAYRGRAEGRTGTGHALMLATVRARVQNMGHYLLGEWLLGRPAVANILRSMGIWA